MSKYRRKTNRPFRKIGLVLTLAWIKEQCVIDPLTECWNWRHAKSPKEHGYAMVSEHGRPRLVSRIVLRLITGLAPKGREKDACHSCDNPPCVNPDHLWWGTRKENLWDSKNKGRALVGIEAYNAKLTTMDVWHIRRGVESISELSRLYGYDRSCIWRVLHREAYRNVPEEEGVEICY